MGGGGWFYTPKVWSPYGGWWRVNHNWKRNTVLGHMSVLLITAYMWKVSAEKERRPNPPLKPIPSQLWAKHWPES
eukprot:CAMPEP_0183291014 /NCGR_PEP_ID=MMETSP0160_2-20130417/574_1 /TAXON_ID=2839 ORGANISM="Odontella Sinensis, Strain Grunow 1884" /NCGR_SAMPLE_ID=MMETSP0160_2 /ASSEMBLY_ACC=CAM_ASM_000250 /LENGTH=74 /DNA_ID=CAMNT_0025451757 /DNA_START=86 /DNA_END=310 /DNA_ORIENTATION=+